MTKFIRIFTLAVFTVFSLGARLEAAASPQDDYLQIYVMINEGDKLGTAGQNSQAREKYETALTRLEKLKNENPEWEPTIVKYRIKYLNDKLAALKTAKETAPPPAPAPVEKPKAVAPAPAPSETITPAKTETAPPAPAPAPSAAPVATSDDPSALRQRIIQLTGDLESARTELKQAKADLDQALVDKKGLQERLSSAGSGDANVAALQQENSALRAKLTSTEESLKKAAGGELGGELASLRAQVDSLEKKLAEANSKSAELARANDDYKKQIADLTGQLQLAGTAGKSDSTLAKENAMLRSILDRQLKEQARREAARRLVLDEFKNLAVSTEALKTQMEVLSSPLVALSAEEENMLKVSAPSLVAPEPEAPAPAAAGGAGATATLSSAAEKTVSPESYSEKPRIPEEFKDTAAKATSLYNEKKFDEAAAAYQEILNKYPQSIYALSNLGVVRFQQQKYPEAEKALREAIRVAPNDAFSHSVLGIVLVQQEKYDDAIQVLSRAVALDPNDAKTRNYLGISSSRKGLQEAAEQECRKAIELDDSYGDAHFNLAVIYATQTPPAKELAKRHYNRALELGVPKDEELEKLLN